MKHIERGRCEILQPLLVNFKQVDSLTQTTVIYNILNTLHSRKLVLITCFFPSKET